MAPGGRRTAPAGRFPPPTERLLSGRLAASSTRPFLPANLADLSVCRRDTVETRCEDVEILDTSVLLRPLPVKVCEASKAPRVRVYV